MKKHSTVAALPQVAVTRTATLTARQIAAVYHRNGWTLPITASDDVRRALQHLQRRAAGEPMDELDWYELVSYVGDRADVTAKLGEV